MGPKGLIKVWLIVVQIFAARFTSVQGVPEEPELAFQDSFLSLEERIGACERGKQLFLDLVEKTPLGVCGCCLKSNQVWYTTCPKESDDNHEESSGKSCTPQPISDEDCCSLVLNPSLVNWIIREKQLERDANLHSLDHGGNSKRIFDLPTEVSKQGPLGPKNTDPKFQGNSGGIAKRFLVPYPVRPSQETSVKNLEYRKMAVAAAAGFDKLLASYGQNIQKQSKGYLIDGSGLLHQFTSQYMKRIFDTFNKYVGSSSSSKGKFIGFALGSAPHKLASKREEDMDAMSPQDKLFLVNYLNNNNDVKTDQNKEVENEPVEDRLEKKKVVTYTDRDGQAFYVAKDLIY